MTRFRLYLEGKCVYISSNFRHTKLIALEYAKDDITARIWINDTYTNSRQWERNIKYILNKRVG